MSERLKLALADPNPFDRSAAKRQKALIREFWGYWTELKGRLERSSGRSIVTYLVDHPTDHRGAFARLKRELQRRIFSAFQSHLWNLILAGWIEGLTEPHQRVPVEFKVGTFPFPRGSTPTRSRAFPDRRSHCPVRGPRCPRGRWVTWRETC